MAGKADVWGAGIHEVQPLVGEREGCPFAISSFFPPAEQPDKACPEPSRRDAQPLAALIEADLP